VGKHSYGFYESAPRRRWKTWLKIFLGAVVFFVLAGVLISYGYVKQLEGRLHKDKKSIQQIQKVITKATWDKPINLLILGSDSRGEANARADTIIVFSVNPEKKRVYVVSIPRDYRVEIPGEGFNKINAANHLGGSELMVKTVESYTTLPIHHYVETDFKGFQKMVDALGGVEIYVDKAIRDYTPGYRMGIPAGYQRMDGSLALCYVRYRHDARGDFGRIERQQKFLKALMDKLLRVQNIFKIPTLANILADNTETDLTISEMVELGNFLRGIDRENVKMVSLPGEPKMIKGVSYVVPDERAVDTIMAAIKSGGDIIETTGTAKTEVKITPKDIYVRILNGCGEKGTARTCQSELEAKGFKVIDVGDADKSDYPNTVIQYLPGQYQKALMVGEYFYDASITPAPKVKTKADIIVIIGKNYLSTSSGGSKGQ
jgi:LCP family protein required for cell wall assembly